MYHSSSVVPWATFYLGTGTMVSPAVNPQGIPQQILVECGHLARFLWHFCFLARAFPFRHPVAPFYCEQQEWPLPGCAPSPVVATTHRSQCFCPLHAQKAEMVRPPAGHYHQAFRSLLGCGERAKAPRGLQMRRLVAYRSLRSNYRARTYINGLTAS